MKFASEAIILPLFFFTGAVLSNKSELENRTKTGLAAAFAVNTLLAAVLLVGGEKVDYEPAWSDLRSEARKDATMEGKSPTENFLCDRQPAKQANFSLARPNLYHPHKEVHRS